jgi:CRP/FNR family transcriptional regulator, cyclic AMP receptor protein
MAQPPHIAASIKREALLSSALFRPMRPVEIDEILGFATERRFPRGSTVMARGDPGGSVMAVLAGRVRVSSVSADGREITLNVIGSGELVGEFGLLDGKPRSNDVIAVEDTTVMVIERRDFMPFLLRHDTLVERLLVVLCDKLRRTSMALEEIALFDVPVRLARLLVKLAADYGHPLPEGEGRGVRIDLKLSQRDLSTLVASTRESVNKQLRVWREEGAIDQRDGYLIVLRPDALQALVE